MAKLTPAQARTMITALRNRNGEFLFLPSSETERIVGRLIGMGYAAESTDPTELRHHFVPVRPTAAGIAALVADAHAAAIREDKKRRFALVAA